MGEKPTDTGCAVDDTHHSIRPARSKNDILVVSKKPTRFSLSFAWLFPHKRLQRCDKERFLEAHKDELLFVTTRLVRKPRQTKIRNHLGAAVVPGGGWRHVMFYNADAPREIELCESPRQAADIR